MSKQLSGIASPRAKAEAATRESPKPTVVKRVGDRALPAHSGFSSAHGCFSQNRMDMISAAVEKSKRRARPSREVVRKFIGAERHVECLADS